MISERWIINQRAFCAFCVVAVSMLTVCWGCSGRRIVNNVEEVVKQTDSLYEGYLTNDFTTAFSHLKKIAELQENIAGAYPAGRAQGLFMTYARMLCMAEFEGQDAAADIAYQKARYWYLVKMQLEGVPDEEIVQRQEVLGRGKCKEIVKAFDDARTNGNAPSWSRGG